MPWKTRSIYFALCWQTFPELPVCREEHRHKRAESTLAPKGHQCPLWHHKGLITRTWSFSTQGGLLAHLENAADLTRRGWTSEQQQHLFADVHERRTAQHLCAGCMTKSSYLLQFGVFCNGCQATGGTWHVGWANRLLPSRTSAHLCWQNIRFSCRIKVNFTGLVENVGANDMKCERLLQMRSLKLRFHYKDQLNQFLFCCHAALEFTRLESL